MRSTGISIIGDVPWGTHFCQFYQDQQDLIDTLVPYFKAGLDNGEFCMWVTSEPLHVQEAKSALAREVGNLDEYLRAGQIEILDYSDWYKIGGTFNAERVLKGWVEKLELAKSRGFQGLRLTGNTFWLEKADWEDFSQYEAMVDAVIGQYQILAICTYSLARCGVLEIMDVVSNHAFALIKRSGQWQTIESAERKKAAASLAAAHSEVDRQNAQLTAILNHLSEGLIVSDLNGNLFHWNPAALKALGFATMDDARRNMSDLAALFELSTSDGRILEAEGWPLARILRGDVLYDEEIHIRRYHTDGKRIFSCGGTLARNSSGQPLLAVMSLRDITEHKLAEEALRQSEQNYRNLVESERAARSEAERLGRIKDEFLANLSHELRSPLNAMLGWSQILRKANVDANTVQHGLDVIERNVRAQTRLISDLLDMSRIISGKLRLDVQNCDLVSVIEAAIDSVSPAAEAKSIKIEKIIDPFAGPVLGDASRLQQVFWNLFSNAVKFTPSRGKVQVISRKVNSHVEISVCDTGQGIAPDFLPYVFDRFRQGDSSASKNHGGLGLGLTIVKHLIELHGGRVTAESAGAGQGATFTVVLPIIAIRVQVSEDAATRPDSNSVESVDLMGIKVLFVDDEADTRDMLARVIQERGADVRAVGSASEAFSVLPRYKPDALVADIGMAEMDGYDMIRHIRELSPEEGGETPAVALTAYSRAEDRTRALLAGYQYHLAKPVEISELIATLATMSKRVRSHRPATKSQNA